jgi:hypothetical protein
MLDRDTDQSLKYAFQTLAEALEWAGASLLKISEDHGEINKLEKALSDYRSKYNI